MSEDNYETTIGVGGWSLVVLSGTISFACLRSLLHYHVIPAAAFAVAIALAVLLLLYRLAAAVNRYDDEEEASRVRRIVPASATGREGSGVAAVAVPLRGDAGRPVPQRPASVVRPLPAAEPALILTTPVPAPVAEPVAPPAAQPAAEPVLAEEPKPAKAKAAAKPKAATKPKAEPKAKAAAQPKAAAKAKPDPKLEAEPKPKAGTRAKAEPKPKAEAKPKAATASKAKSAAKSAPEAPVGLVRLTAPRGGKADDLKEIEGIGPALEQLVNSLGFYHFDQIAAWTEADIALIDAEMKTFKGRITRDKWVDQAKIIVDYGLEAFHERARTNDY